jgi:hypothetical protein
MSIMTPKIVSAKDGKELERLYEQHALAAMQASVFSEEKELSRLNLMRRTRRRGRPGVGSE